MTHHKSPDHQDKRNYIILIAIFIGIGLAMLWASIPQEREVGGAIVYDKPVRTPEITQAIPEPTVAAVEPSDMPKPWVIIPAAKVSIPHKKQKRYARHRQYEYVIIDNTKYYPMMK